MEAPFTTIRKHHYRYEADMHPSRLSTFGIFQKPPRLVTNESRRITTELMLLSRIVNIRRFSTSSQEPGDC